MVHKERKRMTDKRIVTLQDISCFGKCSLTVALPVISAMGISCSVIPTAVLSTHTGCFDDFTFKDLTDEIPKISDHWLSSGLTFDGIYTGYLGSERQIKLVLDFIDRFGGNALKFIDPAMADDGRLYTGFDDDFVGAMRSLCAAADVVVPNVTEASMLLGVEYRRRGEHDEEYVKTLLHGMCELGAPVAVITGVSYDGTSQGSVSYDSRTGIYESYFREQIPRQSHGTGDVFASSFFGALMLGRTLKDAMKIAVDFTIGSIKATEGDDTHWFGVKFEQCIPGLIESIK